MKTLTIIVAFLFTIMSASVNAVEAYGTYQDNPTKPFDATDHKYETMLITWKVVKDVDKECNNLNKKHGYSVNNFKVNGCSYWNGRMCTIITKTKPTMHTIGHEIRHCHEGDWH